MTSTDCEWVYVRKFTRNQLRNASYKVKRSECFKVPVSLLESSIPFVSPSMETEEDVHRDDPVNVGNKTHYTLVDTPCSDDQEDQASQVVHQEIPETVTPALPSAIPEKILPRPAVEVNVEESNFSRPQRARKPPDKLSLNWDSKSYE